MLLMLAEKVMDVINMLWVIIAIVGQVLRLWCLSLLGFDYSIDDHGLERRMVPMCFQALRWIRPGPSFSKCESSINRCALPTSWCPLWIHWWNSWRVWWCTFCSDLYHFSFRCGISRFHGLHILFGSVMRIEGPVTSLFHHGTWRCTPHASFLTLGDR